MRIGLHIAITTLVAAFGGLTTSAALWRTYGDFQAQTDEVIGEARILEDYRHLQRLTDTLVSQSSQLAGIGTLLEPAERVQLLDDVESVADLTEQFLGGIQSTRAANSVWPVLTQARRLQGSLVHQLSEAYEGVAGSVDEHFEQRIEDLGLQLTAALADGRPTLENQVAASSGALDARREQLEARSFQMIALYLLAVLSLWLWSSRRLVVPLANLSAAARRARSGEAAFSTASVGPIEVQDLSESIAAFVEELQSGRELLEEKVRERTEELDRANRAKSEFLAHMSHELRTPMGAILGFSDLLSADGLTEEQRIEYSSSIHTNAQHLLSLLNDILDLSKIEAEQMTIEHLNFDPSALVRDAARLLESRARERGISLELELEDGMPRRIASDPTRLRQILINLVGNGIKFTERGFVRVAVRHSQQDGGRLTVTVQDSGIGIPEEKLESIFDSFAQADSSTTRRFGGTGLGLAISRHLAALLGGSLTVASEVGRGSTFTLTVAAPEVSAGEEREARDETEGPERRFEGRVLIVDDVPLNRRLLSIQLARLGLEVDEAEDGRVAIERIRATEAEGGRYAIVFMDMQMPVLDGYKATRELRSGGYRLPVLALTAHAMSGDRERCLDAGCDGYLTKPVDARSLLESLDRFLGEADLRAAA